MKNPNLFLLFLCAAMGSACGSSWALDSSVTDPTQGQGVTHAVGGGGGRMDEKTGQVLGASAAGVAGFAAKKVVQAVSPAARVVLEAVRPTTAEAPTIRPPGVVPTRANTPPPQSRGR